MTSFLHFTLDLPLMSENQAYKVIHRMGRNRKMVTSIGLTPEAKAWKKGAALQARAALGRSGLELQPDGPLTMDIVVHGNWVTLKDKPRRRDISNLKLLIDAIFEGLGVDDSLVWELRARKEHTSEKESIEVGLWVRPEPGRQATLDIVEPAKAPRCSCGSDRTEFRDGDLTKDWRCLDCRIVYSAARKGSLPTVDAPSPLRSFATAGKPEGCPHCGETSCTFHKPRCAAAQEETQRALAHGMPPSGRHG